MITPPSERYFAALRHAHLARVRVRLYDAGVYVSDLDIVGVTMLLDGQSNVHRNATIDFGVNIYDPETRAELEKLTVQQGTLTIEHGIEFADESVEWVLLATLRIDENSIASLSATRSITAYDRALLVQEHLFETGRPLDQPYATLIETMLNETLPGDVLAIRGNVDLVTAPSTGKVAGQGSQRLAAIQDYADAIGAWVLNDPDGSFVLAEYEDPLNLPVWKFDAGETGVLVDAQQVFSRREQFNAVGIEFTPAEGSDWRLLVFKWDNDPASPTYYDGPFGKRPIFFSETYDHLPSDTVAIEVADRKLDEYSGATLSLNIQAVYNPLLLPGDVVTVEFPDGHSEDHIIDTISLQLGPTAQMDVSTRIKRTNAVRGTSITGSGGRRPEPRRRDPK